MAKNILISYLGADRHGLIAALAGYLADKGGNIGDVTFALLGAGAELNMIYEMPKGLDIKELSKDIKKLPELSDGKIKVSEYEHGADRGPSSRITHRIILSGKDAPGLVAKLTRTLDDHGANIVRMNTEKLKVGRDVIYRARFAVSMREEKAPACLAAIANTTIEHGLTFRYETA